MATALDQVLKRFCFEFVGYVIPYILKQKNHFLFPFDRSGPVEISAYGAVGRQRAVKKAYDLGQRYLPGAPGQRISAPASFGACEIAGAAHNGGELLKIFGGNFLGFGYSGKRNISLPRMA